MGPTLDFDLKILNVASAKSLNFIDKISLDLSSDKPLFQLRVKREVFIDNLKNIFSNVSAYMFNIFLVEMLVEYFLLVMRLLDYFDQ